MIQDASLRLEATNLKTNPKIKIVINKVITNMMFSINLSTELAMGGASCSFSFC